MILQSVERIHAEGELVRDSQTSKADLSLSLIEEVNGIEVGVIELQELLTRRAGRDALVFVSPDASLEEVVRKQDILMAEHLLGGKAHLCAARICDAGRMAALEVEGSDLVDADDDLIYLALVVVVALSHDCGSYFAVGRLASHVVASQVSLAEGVVESGRIQHGADGEDAGCYKIRRVGEMRHREVGKIQIRLPAFSDISLDCAVGIRSHVLYLPFILWHQRR